MQKVFDLHLNFLQTSQSQTTQKHTFAALRSFISQVRDYVTSRPAVAANCSAFLVSHCAVFGRSYDVWQIVLRGAAELKWRICDAIILDFTMLQLASAFHATRGLRADVSLDAGQFRIHEAEGLHSRAFAGASVLRTFELLPSFSRHFCHFLSAIFFPTIFFRHFCSNFIFHRTLQYCT